MQSNHVGESRRDINGIKNKLEQTLIDLGFQEADVAGHRLFQYKGCYYRLDFLRKSFIIEYALNREDATINAFEDGEWISLSLDEKEMLKSFEDIIKKYYMH